MISEGIPEGVTPASRWPARSPQPTPELMVELQVRPNTCTLAAIPGVSRSVPPIILAIDEDPLCKLDAFIGPVDAWTVESHSRPLVEYPDNPRAAAYLQTFLAFDPRAIQRVGRHPRCDDPATQDDVPNQERRHTMGDKGGKKGKEKNQKQMADKQTQKSKEKREKQQPSAT